MIFQQATVRQAAEVTEIALKLWSDHDFASLQSEMEQLLQRSDAMFILAIDGHVVGFAQCQLRYDYVEGTSSSPVGYLEGLYVESHMRKKGIAKQLIAHCETWARTKGCTEFASDCELSNSDSAKMHEKLGFKEVNRIICFTKKL